MLVHKKGVIGIIKAYRKSEYDKIGLNYQNCFTQYAPFSKTSRTPAYCEAGYGLPFLGMYYFSSSGEKKFAKLPRHLAM